MMRRFFGFLGATAGIVLVAGSCVKDPLSDLDGTPAAIITSHSTVQLTQGGAGIAVTASVVDGRSVPLDVPITFTPCDAAVTVTPDATYQPVPATSARDIVRGVAPAASCVNVNGGGLTKQVVAIVLPTSFNGTLAPTAPKGGDTLTITSTASLKFDPALVAVTFSGAATAQILSKTADVIKVAVPFSSAGPVTIAGVNVTYVPGLRVTLPSSTSITQTGDRWAASGSWQTAPDITALLPAAAGQTSLLTVTRTSANNAAKCGEGPGGGSTGPCMFFKFTIASSVTLNFTTDWEGAALAPDVDIYHCNDTTVANLGTACFVTGGSGATAAKPQSTGNDVYAPGTYWFVIEIFDGAGPRNAYVSIAR